MLNCTLVCHLTLKDIFVELDQTYMYRCHIRVNSPDIRNGGQDHSVEKPGILNKLHLEKVDCKAFAQTYPNYGNRLYGSKASVFVDKVLWTGIVEVYI